MLRSGVARTINRITTKRMIPPSEIPPPGWRLYCVGARGWELRSTIDFAAMLSDRGHPGRARALLDPVVEPFTEGFDTVDLAAARRLQATLG